LTPSGLETRNGVPVTSLSNPLLLGSNPIARRYLVHSYPHM
jgi:hypothetical protein